MVELLGQLPLVAMLKEVGGVEHVALIAHDAKKDEMVALVRRRADALSGHHLVATSTTGEVIERETGLRVHRLLSGPLGGYLQIGALIATFTVTPCLASLLLPEHVREVETVVVREHNALAVELGR